MKSYFNSEYHKEILSCGKRHMASVALNSVFGYISFDRNLNFRKNPILNLLKDAVLNQPKKFKFIKLDYIKLDNYKVILKNSELRIISPNGNSELIKNDLWFMNWFTHHYDFSGLGVHTEEILKCMKEMYRDIINASINGFHHTIISAEGDKYAPNPSVIARQVACSFWSAITMINAIECNSYDNLKECNYKSLEDLINSFEDIVNNANNTDFKITRKWYNEKSLKRRNANNYELVKTILGVN